MKKLSNLYDKFFVIFKYEKNYYLFLLFVYWCLILVIESDKHADVLTESIKKFVIQTLKQTQNI